MKPSDGEKPKLPAKQLVILAIARFSEPLALTSVFPYLPELIESFGVEKNSVARWAGATSAVFSVAQSIGAVPWGRASDIYGRKTIILIGLVNTMITFLIWGMATSLPMAFAVRALQGAGSGNVGVIRTTVAEMVTEKSLQPRAFSIMPLVWSLGSTFGPAIGGALVHPAERFPSLFGDSWFLHKFPFALPNIILACFFLISCATGFLFLQETLESKRHTRDMGRQIGKKVTRSVKKIWYSVTGQGSHLRHRHHQSHHDRSLICDEEESGSLLYRVVSNTSSTFPENMAIEHSSPPTKVTLAEVFSPQTTLALMVYMIMALHSVAYDQVLPVFLNYPPINPNDGPIHLPFRFIGGFGLNSSHIGGIFTAYGIVCGLVQILLFPSACQRFGVLNCFKACMIMYPVVYLVTPYTALIQTSRPRIAVLMVIMIFKSFCVIFGFPCITILFTNSATDLRILGTINGFATLFSGIGRAVGPAIAGAFFSWGLNNGTVLVSFWVLGLIAMIGAVPAWWMVEGDGPRHVDDSSSSDDDIVPGLEEEETLVDEHGEAFSRGMGYEDNLTVVDEVDESDDRKTPLLGGKLSNKPVAARHDHTNYSTFIAPSQETVRKVPS